MQAKVRICGFFINQTTCHGLLKAADRNQRVIAAPARALLHDIALLEQACIVVDKVGEAVGALGTWARTRVRRLNTVWTVQNESAIVVLTTSARECVIF